MSKKNKLLKKLIEASGGWEHFLYQTLKEVCDDLPAIDDHTESLSVARDILEAYEETGVVDTVVDEKKVKSVPVVKTQAFKDLNQEEKAETKTVKPTQPDKLEASKPRLVPRKLTAKVAVDNEVGASQGKLRFPLGHVIVNRENLIVTTVSGIQLGRGSLDGQIRGSDVSGHVRVDGTYRLVFKDVNCGFGIVKFEVVPTVDPQNGKKDG